MDLFVCDAFELVDWAEESVRGIEDCCVEGWLCERNSSQYIQNSDARFPTIKKRADT